MTRKEQNKILDAKIESNVNQYKVFSPLGKTFSTGLDKNVQGYQEEGVIKLLKDIRDSLARPPRPNNNRDDNDDNDDNDNDDNDNDDDYDNRPNDERYDNRLF